MEVDTPYTDNVSKWYWVGELYPVSFLVILFLFLGCTFPKSSIAAQKTRIINKMFI